MGIEEKRQTKETPEIKKQREKTKGAAVITPQEKPSFRYGLLLGLIFVAINLFAAAIYFHVINP